MYPNSLISPNFSSKSGIKVHSPPETHTASRTFFLFSKKDLISSQGMNSGFMPGMTKAALWQYGQRMLQPAKKRVQVMLSSKSRSESFSIPLKSICTYYKPTQNKVELIR